MTTQTLIDVRHAILEAAKVPDATIIDTLRMPDERETVVDALTGVIENALLEDEARCRVEFLELRLQRDIIANNCAAALDRLQEAKIALYKAGFTGNIMRESK